MHPYRGSCSRFPLRSRLLKSLLLPLSAHENGVRLPNALARVLQTSNGLLAVCISLRRSTVTSCPKRRAALFAVGNAVPVARHVDMQTQLNTLQTELADARRMAVQAQAAAASSSAGQRRIKQSSAGEPPDPGGFLDRGAHG